MTFLRWVIEYSRNGRHKALALLNDAPAGMQVHHFRRPSEVEQYLESMRNQEPGKYIAGAAPQRHGAEMCDSSNSFEVRRS